MKNHWLKLVTSVFVSVLILWLLLKLISDESNPLDLDDLKRVLSNISASTWLVFLAIHFIGIALRTIRFRVLIQATHSEVVPSFLPLSLVTLVRNMTVDMLPARLGELFYVALLNRGLGVGLGSCFSSLAISIWFDIMVIAPLVLGLLIYPMLGAEIQQRLWVIAVLLVFACVIGILILRPGLGIAAKWLNGFSDVQSRTLASVQSFVDQFAESVDRSLNRATVIKTFVLTVGVRICKYSSIVLLFEGIAAASFPGLVDADSGTILVALLASEAGASLPVPTFMGFGAYEAGGLAAFSMLGLPLAEAGLSLFSVHIATQTVDYTVGAMAAVVFLMITGMKPSMINDLSKNNHYR